MYRVPSVRVIGAISVSSLKTWVESTLNKTEPCAVGSSSTEERLRDGFWIKEVRISLFFVQRYADYMEGEKTNTSTI